MSDETKLEVRKLQQYSTFLYFGQWHSDLDVPEGRGIAINADGSLYEGFFKSGKPNGVGRLTTPCDKGCNVYQGEFIDGTTDSCFGYLIQSNGICAKGEWKSGVLEGVGVELSGKDTIYCGEFHKGVKEGKGKFSWPDGSHYEGEVKANKLDGEGLYLYKNGRKYLGSFKNNKMDGKGVFEWGNGQKYTGEYKNGDKDGYGEFDWGDGQLYKGHWKAGKQHGKGIFITKDGQEKEGVWEHGNCIKLDK